MATLTADIAEIAHILKRERYHRDTAQWDLCRAAFHPDASKTYINVAWFVRFLVLSSRHFEANCS
jgi:hypothetical protein